MATEQGPQEAILKEWILDSKILEKYFIAAYVENVSFSYLKSLERVRKVRWKRDNGAFLNNLCCFV